MKATSVKLVRCAIYTRVSIDQGLDQEFNSLDAQYDASSAYIKSQAHAGWTLIKARYDDGGYSGGSTDRPAEFIDRIDVHKDHLAVRLKPRDNSGATNLNDGNDPTDDRLLSMPWQTPPSKRFRQILLPHGSSRNEIRPERPERRLRLVSAIAQGRRWLDEMISSSVANAEQIALREKCSVRHVNMTISLAFLAPELVRAAVEGRLPRGINIERLRDAPAEWSRQFEALGLNPKQ